MGVGAIVLRDGAILFTQWSREAGSARWSAPGGWLERGESFEQCALRETEEKTGVTIGEPRLLTATNDLLPRQRHSVTIWMIADWVRGEPAPASDDIADAGWYDLLRLPGPLFEPFENLRRTRAFRRLVTLGEN